MNLNSVIDKQIKEIESLYQKLKIAIVGLEAIREYGDSQDIAKKTLEEIDKT